MTGILGVGLAAIAGDSIRRLYATGAFGYDGATALGPHIDPLTPSDKFYVVTKNLIDPHIDLGRETDDWRLETPVVQMAGVAFAADRGVARVEVSTDGGQTWHEASIVYKESRLTWALWRYDWRPLTTATYKLVVRATDGTGAVQTAKITMTDPQGATGCHEVMATIQA